MKLFFVFCIATSLVITTHASIQITVSQISVQFNNPIKQYFTNCNGANIEMFLQLTSSSYSNQQTFSVQQYDASSTSWSFTNQSSFTIPQSTSFVSISAVISLTCGTVSPLADSFLLFTQSNGDPDSNNIANNLQTTSTNNKWILGATVLRQCNMNNYGFNCDQSCITTDDGYNCFTCGSYGQKTCCSSLNVNQTSCAYYNAVSTTQNPYVSCDTYYQNLYFWFMIAFVIFSFVLLVLLIALLLLFYGCCQRSKKTEETHTEADEWSEPIEPRANRTLYDGHIDRPYSKRETRSGNRSPAPYFINREGLENRTFEEESISNEWIEPQPRRIARV
ncbi:unnamed protein product [Caenorhabditis angaria]|uniref:Uncharacterized protein n=1 Tax=Caenorhabditis angaria TaxID=860376 RepID=A0A9P1N8D7_9PELO|nr:unnamed protein product [Caenorhabditis angaria]